MIKIIMHGYLGKIGTVICGICEASSDIEIVAGVDCMPSKIAMPFPTYKNIWDCDMNADVIIDFSTASAVPALLKYCGKKNIGVVVCTTGLSDDTLRLMEEISKKTPVFKSANMSVGINLLSEILKKAAPILAETGFDIEIIEKHHNQKIDAPSGTALLLADTVNKALSDKMEYVYDRSPVREKRKKKEIGIHAVRGGTIVGEHTIVFAGKDEVLELTHIAQSKEVFAVGAVKAARFLKDKPPGFYSMENIMV